LAALAGLIGAAAFTHSAGYFVTFMTGNSERAVLGFFARSKAFRSVLHCFWHPSSVVW
jgi:uncharacterized membrane protein YoaK (UPF0700 family)